MILIADDEPSVLAALQLLFSLHDLPVALARTPEQAVQRAAEGDVRAVVQDLNFVAGETDGRTGVALLRKLRGTAPVIVMSAWLSRELAEQLEREGAAAVLEKPWDDERLVSLVRGLLQRKPDAGLQAASVARG